MAARRKTGAPARASQPHPNPDRGEHSLMLGGTKYRLRPSHAAIVEIETATDRSALELATIGNRGGLKRIDMGTIAGALIRAGAADPLTAAVDDERIAELIGEEGTSSVMPRLTLCLLDAVTGGVDVSGNAKAAAA